MYSNTLEKYVCIKYCNGITIVLYIRNDCRNAHGGRGERHPFVLRYHQIGGLNDDEKGTAAFKDAIPFFGTMETNRESKCFADAPHACIRRAM